MEKVLERTKKLSDVIRILDVEINFLEHSVRKNGEEVCGSAWGCWDLGWLF